MKRAARLYWRYLETVCDKTGHIGACAILNSWHGYGRPGRAWHRLVHVVLMASE